ncbi:FliM/FliN family flagellar motor C-terminal domain-containing protein [Aquabacterium sp. A7-Y]|uniref:FliM/FliN family flagellar motor C-terminal domain-containing protein n=1 Tax=Aquabacterium sp. A7-Y TaxID=1349605 RepID=UPI00223CE44C|nr:FliM/FliN family flagellar motor C-terminal domain-containing protein [Aquabacterium sp. A7-Y]MCW7536516.1 FliM/FliN family flagellar motor C-terminal domain-containing protein [Aquabacterium sp. A7-Y]
MKLTTSPLTPCQVLDPSTLGRPVHRLDRFTRRWREDLGQQLRDGLNRRWRTAFEIGEVSLQQRLAPADAGRWMAFTSAAGRIACAIERPLLLALLARRYGAPVATPAAVPETATEERLAAQLAQQFAEALAGRIEAGCTEDAPDTPGPAALQRAGLQVPRTAGWTLQARVLEPALDIDTSLWFTLDAAWMDRLLAGLAPARPRATERSEPARPLSQQLRLTLTARLLEKELPLGELLALRVGDLIPVRLGPTEVLVDDTQLFTATVAEHQGKLCLTAFSDVD